MFKINRSEHYKSWGAQKSFGVKAKLPPNVASNLPLGTFTFAQGLFVQGLDILKIYC